MNFDYHQKIKMTLCQAWDEGQVVWDKIKKKSQTKFKLRKTKGEITTLRDGGRSVGI